MPAVPFIPEGNTLIPRNTVDKGGSLRIRYLDLVIDATLSNGIFFITFNQRKPVSYFSSNPKESALPSQYLCFQVPE